MWKNIWLTICIFAGMAFVWLSVDGTKGFFSLAALVVGVIALALHFVSEPPPSKRR